MSEAYQALYRKYRPVTFDDVIGQKHITDVLRGEVKSNRIAHAYLFTGSRGTGKTTCAKILSKAANCLNVQNGSPCGECEMCCGIDDGSITDVLEIDAASNNSVDNIRDLRAETNYTPAAAKYRVYIIDEAHMLSIGAANALLKIMEEPPEYVIFILATTEVHKIPATILSRCQRFDFKRIDPELIAERLMNISDKESIGLEKDAAALIAKLSDGGMRDALSLLDLCRSATDGSVTVENVADAAGLAGSGHLFELTEAFIKRAPAEAIEILGRLYASSADPSRVCEQLIGHFRNLMLMKNSSKAAEMIVCLPDELEQLRQLASRIEGGYIFYALSVLQETLERLARSSSRRTELEMAFVKLCSPEGGEGTDALIARISTLEQEVRRLKRMLEQGVVPAAAVQPAQQEQPAAEKKAPAERKAPAPAAKTEPEAPMEEMDETLWGHILNTLGKSNPALNAALLVSKAYIRGDLLLVDSKDDLFLQLMRTSDYAKESLREAVVAETGKKYRLGPYKKEKAPEKTASPLDSIAEAAKNAGIDIQIK
ncbi:MAG: DNA polymerase III subunit gamma/tau [Oscillospiraceae bacterium]|nr:DNA polymerase III subunit gamma/tau [Oscillospiraceae bacterium]